MQSSTLEFQNFDLDDPEKDSSTRIDISSSKSPSFTGIRDSADIVDNDSERISTKSFWTFEYYQQFFDVNTDEVKTRLLWAMIPRPGRNYLDNCLKPNPDLYGPFWICTTLIFTIAVSGNVANYLQYAPTGNYSWKYDFHLISYAASAIFAYASLVPLGLYAFMKWNNSIVTVSFLELLCAYGYSLAIYVPVSILSVIQVPWFQWLLIIVGSTLSVVTLVTTVASSVEGAKKIPSVAIVVVLHYLLAAGFLIYSFNIPSVTSGSSLVLTAAPPPPPAILTNLTEVHEQLNKV